MRQPVSASCYRDLGHVIHDHIADQPTDRTMYHHHRIVSNLATVIIVVISSGFDSCHNKD